MSEVKRCVQCGFLKEAEAFRKYTYSRQKGTEGRYRTCKECEATNQRYKVLQQKLKIAKINGDRLDWREMKEMTEIEARIAEIEGVYDILEANGLRTPRTPETTTTTESKEALQLEKIRNFYKMVPNLPPAARTTVDTVVEVPDELKLWLEADTSQWMESNLSPEYLQETIYESLKAKYRPQVGIDKEKYVPLYDDTYKDVLNKILRRFDDYEEEYASQGEDYEEEQDY